jgi:cysteine desulfurase
MISYLDMAATTPTDPRVAELVVRLMTEEFGNAGSRTHSYGADALGAVKKAREQIARVIRADPADIIFTSGATEADNLAILGLAPHGLSAGKRHIVSSAIEHKAVLEPLEHLAAQGFEVTLVAPNRDGYVSADEVSGAIRPDTLLVSVMHANNETGAIQPIAAIADRLSADGPVFHVDAAQTFGRLNEELSHPRIDLLSLSGHKNYAPKGIGALVMRRRNGRRPPLRPLMFGGGQERGLRPGTLPVPLIAGFGLAAQLAQQEFVCRQKACEAIRLEAINALRVLGPIVHGDSDRGVLPHILSIAIPGVDSEAFMVAAKELIAISNGSACTSASYTPSHVLRAMGMNAELMACTVRISWSHQSADIPWLELAARIDDLRL